MQFGHVALALSIATYDWSIGNALFCLGMHYLPNTDSLMVKAGWDQKLIRGAIRLESLLPGHRDDRAPEVIARDPFWVEKGGFHCTVTHSVAFAVAVSLLVSLFSWEHALLAFVAIISHYAADIGSTVGLPLLWPFTRRKYTLALFEDTGWWGREMFIGYYRQPMAWFLETVVLGFMLYRFWVI